MKTICNKMGSNFGPRVAACILSLMLLPAFTLLAQTEGPFPAQCGMTDDSTSNTPAEPMPGACGNTSDLYLSHERHLPDTGAQPIRVRANFIILQRADGSGNFQNNTEDVAFLNDWFYKCNERLRNLWGTSSCSPLVRNAKIQIVPNWIFLADTSQGEYRWNNDNGPGSSYYAEYLSWYLNSFDTQITQNTSIPKGINVYFTVDKSIYLAMVVNQTIDSPSTNESFNYVWSAIKPTDTSLVRSSRIHIPNLYLKYWWFKNRPETVEGGTPFSTTRQWLVDEGVVLAHEFAHCFVQEYTHIENDTPCTNHLLNQANTPRSTLREKDVQYMHRAFARTNLRQFIECDVSYHTPGNSQTDRVVTIDEVWDMNMRFYSHIVVKTGATLRITCEVLMPENGRITVERGAKLIVDGGTVRRANTCTPQELWTGVAVHGNAAAAQPGINDVLTSTQAGVVVLKNNGMIEGAIVGVTTRYTQDWDIPDYRGGVVDAANFTFRDCRKGVEFMKYDFPNKSKFKSVTFERTTAGTMQTGVSIWDTDTIHFDSCLFRNMVEDGIRTIDARYVVGSKNRITGSKRAIYSGATFPLSSYFKIGHLGLNGDFRNVFENNTVGIRATANTFGEVFSNDFANYDFDVALNGTTRTTVTDNLFEGSAAGMQLDKTGFNDNRLLCNVYEGNRLGNNIAGSNLGFRFRQEEFNTLDHDLFIQGDTTNSEFGEIPNQGGENAATWNFFTLDQDENIKTSTVFPFNNTVSFTYYFPQTSPTVRTEPKCASNDTTCNLHSNFEYKATLGQNSISCSYPDPNNPPCTTKGCLESLRQKIGLIERQEPDPLVSELRDSFLQMVTERERITDELINQYRATNDWEEIDTLLLEDPNPFNNRRYVGIQMERQFYVKTGEVLDSFPVSTFDDVDFVTIQRINLERMVDSNFVLDSIQASELLSIALSQSSEAGYAQSLLLFLTGQVFMPELPELEVEEREFYPVQKPKIEHLISVYPNPTKNRLSIEISKYSIDDGIVTLKIFDLLGQVKFYQPISSLPYKKELNLETWTPGFYVVCVMDIQGRIVGFNKILLSY